MAAIHGKNSVKLLKVGSLHRAGVMMGQVVAMLGCGFRCARVRTLSLVPRRDTS